MSCPVTMRVESCRINQQQQQLVVAVVTEKPEGKNFFGKVATFFAAGLIDQLIHDKVSEQEMVVEQEKTADGSCLTIDLSQVEAIRRLKEPLPLVSRSTLQLLEIKGLMHVRDGVVVELKCFLAGI